MVAPIKLFSKYIFLLLCLTILSHRSIGQTQQIKDSLHQQLRSAKTDAQKIDALNGLSYEYYDFDDSIAFYYGREALALAKKTNYPKGLQFAYTLVGAGHFSFGDYENGLKNFALSNAIPLKDGDLDHHLYNMMLMGNVLSDIGQYDSALVVLQECLKIAIEKNSLDRQASVYKARARIQTRLWQNDEALKNLARADSLRQNKTQYEQADMKYLYAMVYINQSDIPNASAQIQDVCKYVQEIDDNFHKTLCHLMQSELNRLQGQYPVALNEAFQALEITEIYTYPYLRAQIFLQIGFLYSDMSQYPIAQEFLFKTLRITEKSKIDPITAHAYTELGWIFKDQKKYKEALEYLQKAETIYKNIGDKKGEAAVYNVRGLIFLLQEKYPESTHQHELALEIRKSLGHQGGVAASLFNISLVLIELKDYNKAIDFQQQALIIDEAIGEPLSLSVTYSGMANLLIRQNQLDKAEFFIRKLDSLARQTESKTIQRANYKITAHYFEVKGEYKKALSYTQKFISINDSILSENNSMKIGEMQSLYDVERKEQQITLLSKEKELQSNQLALQKASITNQNIIIITGSVILLLIGGILFYIARTNQKLKKAQRDLAETNEELMTQSEELRESNDSLVEVYTKLKNQQDEIQQQAEELKATNNDLEAKRNEVEEQAKELREANKTISANNQDLEEKVEKRTEELKQAYIELDTFFYRSSHDFRRPITTFIGLAEVAKITSKDETTLELFSKVKETALSLDRMIRKLQTISDVGAQKMIYKEILVRELIANILDNHSDELSTKKIKVIEEIEMNDSFLSYGALVNVILENLIENAIQFATPLDPHIKIRATSNEKTIVFQIEDNGQGIPEEYHQKIFDMYFRASVSSKGNGLGLYIVKKAVNKLEGTIRFETTLNHGTKFIVELPITSS